MTTDRRTPWWRWLAAVATIALALSACSSGDEVDLGDDAATDATNDGATDGGGSGGDNVLIAAQGSEPDRLDPHLTSAYASFQVLENIYDTLVQPGDDLTMEPALAESWETSDDNLTWTFHLREGVTFHNGRDLVADDVVYSFERIRDEETGAGASYRFGNVDSITAVDDATVEITVSSPTPNLLVLLGGYKGLAIVPSEIVDDGSIDTHPVGTGPFRFVESSPDGGIVLERNPDYWRADEGLPKLDGIVFQVIPDETVKLTNLQSGEVDWIDAVPPQQLADLESDDSVVLERVAGGDYHYFALNENRPPFDDVRVRRAIAMAIDRETITEAAQFGGATANQTAIPAGTFWSFDYAPFTTGDIDGAQALLDEAGVGDLTIELLVTSDNPETVTQAEVIASQLEPLGITVEIADVDFNTWLDREANGEFDAFMLSWVGNIDPDEFYYAQHHSEGGFNFQGYANTEVDTLLDQARTETDPDARKALYDQAATIIVDEASYIYLYNPDNVQAWTPGVSGYHVRGDNAIRFVDTELTES